LSVNVNVLARRLAIYPSDKLVAVHEVNPATVKMGLSVLEEMQFLCLATVIIQASIVSDAEIHYSADASPQGGACRPHLKATGIADINWSPPPPIDDKDAA